MTGCWPWPGDAPVVRARRVAQAYRARLLDVAPELAADLDERFASWGERWVAPRLAAYELDQWLTAAQAADLGGVDTATVRMWRARGRLRGNLTDAGWMYRARDVVALMSKPRGRTTRSGSEVPGGSTP